jgi:hypothetical protein
VNPDGSGAGEESVAMDYVGTDEARAFIKQSGLQDDDDACKQLTKRIARF